MKKSIMAALLAGVMTVSVVTAGCGKNDDEKDKSEKSIKEVTHSISDTLEQAEKAMKGELEFAYDANMNITFGSVLGNMVGAEIKPIDITTSTKQKGKKTAADMAFKYDSQTLVSVNSVYDHKDEKVFIQVPELNESYLTGTKDDVLNIYDADGIADDTESSSPLSLNVHTGLSKNSLNTLKDIDFEKLEDDAESYVDLIKEKAPEPKDGEKISGEIDGHKYTYDTKTYEIKGEDVKTISAAVVDKAKSDTFVKDIVLSMGVTEEEYNSTLDSAKAETDAMSEEEAKEKLFEFDAYYDGDDLMGIKMNIEEANVDVNYIIIDDDDVMAMDYSVKCPDVEITVKGSAVKNDDDKINGELNYDMTIDDVKCAFKATLTDVAENDGVFTGTVTYDYNIDQDGTTISPIVVLTSNSTKDKMDLSFAVSMNDTEYFTVKMTGEETDASDITLPTGTLYSLTNEKDLESYEASCDFNGFSQHVESVLGSDLINAFAAGSMSNTEDYDYEDYEDFGMAEDEDELNDVA